MASVISLKKYIESDREALLKAAVACYRSALSTTGDSILQACRPIGTALYQTFANLQARISDEASPGLIHETEDHIESELKQWSEMASSYFQQQTDTIKEILLILTRTAQSVGKHNEHHAVRIGELAGRLESIARLNDLVEMRDHLTQSARDLQDYVDQMAKSGEESVARLRQDVNKYQAQLENAERLATTDPLTGLGNRLTVESAIEFRLPQKRDFSLILFDLNDFKQINDSYGHLPGDELLKLFSAELQAGFRPIDVVGRWGGDEFIVILDCGREEARNHVQRVRKWVLGEYTIHVNGEPTKVSIDAAAGVASWQPGDTLDSLLSRADRAMYADKHRSRLTEVRN